MTKEKPFPIPVNYFGMVLGLAAFGLAWRYGTTVIALSVSIGETLLFAAGAFWLCFVLAYIYKWVAYRKQAQEELRHPILGCFVSLIPITTMLIGLATLPSLAYLAYTFIALGIIGQLAFFAYRSAGLWKGGHPPEATSPVLYLPTVATNFVSATCLGTLGYNDWGMLFFGAGVISWFMLEPAVARRFRNLEPLAEPIRPIMGIQLAPPFVGCSAYFAVNGGEVDLLVKLLIGYGLLQLLLLLRLLPWIAIKGFSMPFWAFSFGLASMAGVGLHLHIATQGQSIGVLGLIMFWFAAICIGLLLLGTLNLIIKGKFLVK